MFSTAGIVATVALGLVPHANVEKPACHTNRCEIRIEIKQKKRYVAPYRWWLERTGRCESGSAGGYSANTGNGFYGRYQFTLPSWRAVGGQGMPHLNPGYEQDYRAVKLLKRSGRGNWPVCG